MDREHSADELTDGHWFKIDNGRLNLIASGPERLKVLLELIDTARSRLDIFYYIIANDDCGKKVIGALQKACERGVAVTVLVDAFGSAFSPDSLFAPLVQSGARFGRFGKKHSTRYLIRNHQKMAIADGQRALIGGFNVEEAYFAEEDQRDGWRDMGCLVEGELVGELQRWFDLLAEWTLSERQRFRDLRRIVREWKDQNEGCNWLVGGPTRLLNGWARRMKHDLQSGERLDMVAAYFSPGWGMLRRLCALGRRGQARLITASLSDNVATIGAARHLYRRMIRSCVDVREYLPQRLHAKFIVIDDVTYLGSANFDMRSLFLNVELMLRVEDADFARGARAEIDRIAGKSRQIDLETYRSMSGPLSRLRWWMDYLLVGVLDYTVTRRLNFRFYDPDS